MFRLPKSIRKSGGHTMCPHCWHTFDPRKALYIENKPDGKQKGDPVVGKAATIQARLPPEAVLIDNATGQAKDPDGYELFERACPSCHLQVPNDLLDKRPIIMSMAGAPASGKSYFITVMLHTLRRQLAAGFHLAFNYADSHHVQNFIAHEDALFHKKRGEEVFLDRTVAQGNQVSVQVTIQGTATELPRAFLFSMQATPSNVESEAVQEALHQNFALYDNAGELFKLRGPDDPALRTTGHLRYCDIVFFVFDPLQDQDFRHALRDLTDDPQVEYFENEGRNRPQDEILQAVANQMKRLRGLSGTKKIDVPLIVVVQKHDAWKGLLPAHVKFDDSSISMFEDAGTCGVDYPELNRISLHMREFLNGISPTFVATAEAAFGTVRYFPVSASGCSPTLNDSTAQQVFRAGEIKPWRVTDPMLWILQRFRLVRRARSKPVKTNAEIRRVADGRLLIKLPESGKSIWVDTEYAGSVIEDPWTGDKVNVPALETEPSTPAQPDGRDAEAMEEA
jgi:hypothetical protein